jgi:hypothetical protein
MLISGVSIAIASSSFTMPLIDVAARVNSLYRIRDGQIKQIVKGNPQWPQSFYPLASPVEILSGDYIVGQCVYDNDDDRPIQVG